MGHGTIRSLENKFKYSVALFLTVCVFILAFLSVDNSCYWGDDYAAYINQGIAMAEGRLDEQAVLNRIMHPSVLSKEGQGDELVYVWGYPLILSIVYRLVGFDRAGFGSIVFYKLPSVLALAALAGVLYLFYLRRFGPKISFLLALVFCCCSEFFDFLNTLYSDIVFLFFAMLSVYICEVYLDSLKSLKRRILAVTLGICLWFTYEIRLNGISIVLVCALLHLGWFWRARKRLKLRSIIWEFIPYLVYAVLVLLSETLIAKATPNSSDLASGLHVSSVLSNCLTYLGYIHSWFALLWDSILISPAYSILRRIVPITYGHLEPVRSTLAVLSCLFCGIGLLIPTRREIPYAFFVEVYIITASLLPYTQGLRYIYPLLPFLLLSAGSGVKLCFAWLRLPKGLKKIGKALAWPVLVLCCALVVYPHVSAAMRGDKGVNELEYIGSPSDIYKQNAYSPAAIEVYNFIQNETEDDCCIAFFAPRGLYLNTQRLSVRPGVNGHSMDEADYQLRYLKVGDYPIDSAPTADFESIFENEEFILYKRIAKP